MSVVDIISEQDELKAHSHELILWRRKWEEYRSSNVFVWQSYRLNADERSNIPDEPGIYSLLVQPGIAGHPACSYLFYLGKSVSLRGRFNDYLTHEKRETGRPKIFRLLNMYPNHVWFCYMIMTEDEIDTSEEELMEAYMPPANDQLPAAVRNIAGAF